MTQYVHMAVYDTLADWEVGYATAHINNGDWQREPGRYEVRTVGATREPIRTKGGLTVVPDLALDELTAEGSAMLILPGADTWLTGGNADFAKRARQFLDAGVPVAAICGATGGLAAEGLLDDRKHTSNAAEFVEAFGSKGTELYCDVPAVTDRGLITASGTRPVEFAREVFAALELYTPEVLDSWYKLYGLGDPAGYYELMGAAA
ncbi:type 1 glutamine amidotransferase family protein [Glycomyces albidus]|uniref:Glutamine amidotransferase n=1 Tax=Glycomyces albidus TaxID=2656774 RepID=A0A6L5G8E2_9ACTN|nr:type 1 glutamine amidotransferase family protein [Glycomyces albidus]MQM25890.1 glutamine amidotransferase [Glycomyces albidus]